MMPTVASRSQTPALWHCCWSPALETAAPVPAFGSPLNDRLQLEAAFVAGYYWSFLSRCNFITSWLSAGQRKAWPFNFIERFFPTPEEQHAAGHRVTSALQPNVLWGRLNPPPYLQVIMAFKNSQLHFDWHMVVVFFFCFFIIVITTQGALTADAARRRAVQGRAGGWPGADVGLCLKSSFVAWLYLCGVFVIAIAYSSSKAQLTK